MTQSTIHARRRTARRPARRPARPARHRSTGVEHQRSRASGQRRRDLGGTDFLTLMLAQLKNQDPTSPVDSNEFLTQLAELSEVQGITQLNTSFTTLSNSLVGNQACRRPRCSASGAGAELDGHAATAGATVTGAVSVPQTTSQVSLNIANSSGVLVQQINLGAQSAGLANFTWNGTERTARTAPAGPTP
jgi:flagellar basal-body rod modification protein FlgD